MAGEITQLVGTPPDMVGVRVVILAFFCRIREAVP